MIYLIDGDDRKKAEQEARHFLGDDIEVIDADTLEKADLTSIFQGTTIFDESRHILIKDLSLKKDLFLELPKFIDINFFVKNFYRHIALNLAFIVFHNNYPFCSFPFSFSLP